MTERALRQLAYEPAANQSVILAARPIQHDLPKRTDAVASLSQAGLYPKHFKADDDIWSEDQFPLLWGVVNSGGVWPMGNIANLRQSQKNLLDYY